MRSNKFDRVETPGGVVRLPYPMTDQEYRKWVPRFNIKIRENKVIYLKVDKRARGMLTTIKGNESALRRLLTDIKMGQHLIDNVAIYADSVKSLVSHAKQRGYDIYYRGREIRL